MWPAMTFNLRPMLTLNFFTKLWFINECTKNYLAKIQQVTEFSSFLWDIEELSYLMKRLRTK